MQEENYVKICFHIPICIKIPAKKGVVKLLSVLLRLIVDEKDKPMFSFQNIADMLGFKDRRDIDNYYREFKQKDCSFASLLARKAELSEHKDIIQDLFVQNPLLPVSELYMLFNSKHPDIKMSQSSFNKYFGELNAYSVSQHIHKCIDKKDRQFDNDYLITYLAKNIDEPVIKKKILDMEQEKKKEQPKTPKSNNSIQTSLLSFLVLFLVGSGMSYDLIAFMLNISKSYVYKLVYNIHDINRLILSSINKWSGKICVDEKYVKLDGTWRYVFSIVDAVTGVPLLVDYFENKTSQSWQVFFTRFKQMYGTPKLIVSDGCLSLAKGRIAVFPNVPYQYCKFHKMRNLIKKIYMNIRDPKTVKLAITKLKQVFARETRGGRRKALLELERMLSGEVKDYLDERIMKVWKHLTKSLTSNAAERWNRKIEKIVSGKYGLKRPETIQQLVYCLWFKELITNGRTT